MAKTIYNFKKIEAKWQKKWEKSKIFQVKEDKKKKKFYVLEMFPYASGSGLHMGHAFNYTIGDIYARFKRMQGFNVLYPIGYDSFGLPAENAAIKVGEHPKKYTEKAILNFEKQLKLLGFSYDWGRKLATYDKEYYKWNQFFFLKFLEKGFAYRKKAPVNWCPKCNTVLANEQVHGGKCEYHRDTNVKVRHLEQWFIKTTKYSDELLDKIDALNWPSRIKIMQKNWIGKSYGTEIDFEIEGKKWAIFTTRPDTIYGVTFMVISVQHPELMELVTKEQKKEIEKFLKKIKTVSEKELGDLEKEGVFTGSYATNPINGEKIPVYAGNFVVADYGSGMVMGVPAHDQRDFEFAEKYGLPIKRVIAKEAPIRSYLMGAEKISDKELISLGIKILGKTKEGHRKIEVPLSNIRNYEKLINKKMSPGFWNEYIGKEIVFIFKHKNNKIERIVLSKKTEEKIDRLAASFMDETWDKSCVWKWLTDNDFYTSLMVHAEEGFLVNSGEFSGLGSREAIKKITKHFEKKNLGRKSVQYKFRDWLISRQRYWGTPIPIVYCGKCGIIPVSEKDLPIKLPMDVTFGKGNPLATNKKFLEAKCPKCRGKAKRETDTMDTFFDSAWYYLRYCDNENSKKPFEDKRIRHWMPVDQYIGGAEHATMHLIYARFFIKALRDLGYVEFDEPFSNLFNQGMLHAKDGRKMSKSFGNVINPLEFIEKYSADSLRLSLMSFASPDSDTNWDEKVLIGSFKFLEKVYRYFIGFRSGKIEGIIEHKLNKTVKEVKENIEKFKYNLAIIKIRELFSYLEEGASKKDAESFLIMLHPFCPHITEELWQKLGSKGFISLQTWPIADEKKINERFEKQEREIRKLIEDINKIVKLLKKKPKKAFVYTLPNEKQIYQENIDEIKKRTSIDIEVYAVNDKDKYDPENKSKKVKPGRPGIYIK